MSRSPHDDEALHPEVGGALFHLAEVGGVFRLIHEKLVHILDGMNAMIMGHLGKIEVVDLSRFQLRINRPLGQRYLKERQIFGLSMAR